MKKISTKSALKLPIWLSLSVSAVIAPHVVIANEQDDFLSSGTEVNNSVPAKIMSLQNAMISAEIAANVNKINVDVGAKVEKNQVIAELDCREFTIKETLALAEINSLEAKLPGIEARIEAAKSNVSANVESEQLFQTKAKASQASVQAGKADVNRVKAKSKAETAKCHLAGLNVKRARDLGKRKIISQQEVDQAESEYQAAQAECSAVGPEIINAQAKTQSLQANASAARVAIKVQQAKTKMASSNIKVQEAEIPELNARIAAAKAKLETEKLMVDRCELKAPFAGEVVKRNVQLGQRIGIGESAFRIISLQERELSASVSGTELDAIKKADSLYFGTPDFKYPIQFRTAVGLLDGEARTQEVRFTFKEGNTLPIGLSGRVLWESK